MPESLCLGKPYPQPARLVSRTRPLAAPRELFTEEEEEEEGSLLFRAAFVSSPTFSPRIINVPLGRLLLLPRGRRKEEDREGGGMSIRSETRPIDKRERRSW